MNFGDADKERMGECNKETAFEILDTFKKLGGNFVDTANGYQHGQSEEWVGEWLTTRKNRDEMVIATKYSSAYQLHHKDKIQSNFGGNGIKSLRISVDNSLKRLQTPYIDLLYLHWWDYATSIPELMHSLNDLVVSGKVMYLGISDTPAWVVAKANQYARDHGLRQFSVYQGMWNAALRDFEREIIPMCLDEGMAILPYVFPLVGGRKVEHIVGNIEALKIQMNDSDIAKIEEAYPFNPGFPHTFLSGTLFGGEGERQSAPHGPGEVWLTNIMGTFDWVEQPKSIKSAQK